jgi:hypothetical protein
MAAVSIADLIGRLALDFQLRRVLLLESLLFGAACLLLAWSARRDRPLSPTAVRVELCLAVAFGLGSIRAGLWFAGLPVGVANMVVLGLGLFVAIGYLARRRVLQRSRAA